MTDHDPERRGRLASLTWYGQAGSRLAAGESRVLIDPFFTDRPDRRYRPPALAPDVLMVPINGRDHVRESRGIVGNMNETEAAWLCAEVGPSYAIPMHYE
jgi:L-ascorbate metabolism protein UlaG (beta-lactamase superfamily)